MSDIVQGMIIGGIIGVVGSAVVAWIQGHYSFKGKKEENLARQHQQSTQIQHEKDSQLISRRIAVRSRYLDPLSSHLSSLHTSINNYEEKLIGVLRPYYREGEEIQVPEVNKQEFIRQLKTTKSTHKAIFTPLDKVWEVSSQVGDPKLLQEVNVISDIVLAFYKACNEMYNSLVYSTTGQDLVYDFKAIVESMNNIRLGISGMHRRIESLLAGVDEDEGKDDE